MTQFMWRKPCLAKLHLKLELWPTTAFVAVYLDPFLPRDLEFVLVQPRPKCLGHHHSHHRSPWDLVATFGALPHRPGNPSPPHPSTMLLPLTTHHSKDVRQSKYRRPDVFWSKRQHGQVEILHQVKSAPGADIFLWNVFPDLFEGSWHVIKKSRLWQVFFSWILWNYNCHDLEMIFIFSIVKKPNSDFLSPSWEFKVPEPSQNVTLPRKWPALLRNC